MELNIKNKAWLSAAKNEHTIFMFYIKKICGNLSIQIFIYIFAIYFSMSSFSHFNYDETEEQKENKYC